MCLFYQGAYADVASYMVMTEESVNDLNSRLVNPVTEHHFRPNLVVKGCPAYSEDSWDWLRVNDVILRSFKYCTRSETYLCVLIFLNDKRLLMKEPCELNHVSFTMPLLFS